MAPPFLRRLSNLEIMLSSQEIQIANLIKESMTTKDIARLMNLSPTTINFQRRKLEINSA